MRGTIRRFEANLEALQVRFDASEMRANASEMRADAAERRADTWEISSVNTSALMKAFNLISLFHIYHLSKYDWNAVTVGYKKVIDKVEKLISTDEFDKSKATFNAKYPMPSKIPLLSDLIDLHKERHGAAHNGQIKTIVKQEKFLDECKEFF